MCPPGRSLGSICVITSCLVALALAGCTSSGSSGSEGGSGGISTGTGGSATGSGGSASGGSASGGSTGRGGATGEGGATSGTNGSGGAATGTGGGNGSGGAPAGTGGVSTGGVTGAAGTAGRGSGGSGGTSGVGGKGGANGSGGAAGGPTGVGGGSGGHAEVDAGVGSTTIPGNGCTPPAEYANLFVTVSGHTQADSDTKVAAAWSSLFNPGGSGTIYYNGPGSNESYVEDTYNNDVRTEGMSYGMMIAVQLGHQTEFDRLWTFVKNHMAQGTTGQIAWHVSTSGSKLATGGAPDGDEYFAAALVFAHTRWGDTSGMFNYATEAQWVLNLIRTQDFNATYHIVAFYAGAGNTDGSYILPAFYQTWACFDTANADFWNSAVTAGRTWFHNAINSNGVIPDQSAFTNGSSGSAGSDTIRCVANIMMDHNFYDADSWQTATYAPEYGSYESSHASGVAQQSCNALLGFGLPTSTGKPFVDKLWSTSVPQHDYWDGILYMLAVLHVSGTFHLWY
jgi:oligosaccharide reducing-end xylanase